VELSNFSGILYNVVTTKEEEVEELLL